MTKTKAISITFNPKGEIKDETVNKIIDYCLPLCNYYHFVTEKQGPSKHMHASLYLQDEVETKYFNRDIKNKLLKAICAKLDGTILKHAYKGKSIYNDDWLNNYCKKDPDMQVVKSYLPDDKAKLAEYYRETKEKKFYDYVHFEFEKAFKEHNPELTGPYDIKDIEMFLCYQMYGARTRRVIQEPRKAKNLILSLRSYMNKSTSFNWHSNVQVYEMAYQTPPVLYSCQECRYSNEYPKPPDCHHMSD